MLAGINKIKLTQGQFALVDSEDFNKLSQYKWWADYNTHTKSYYAKGYIGIRNGKQIIKRMHRVIMNAPNKLQVDHINHNTLDNRKQNLRLCTNAENQCNQKGYENTTSKYKGVCWHKRDKVWTAQIQRNKKQVHLGYFDSEIQAAKAYNKKAKELFGEYTLSNNITGGDE